MSAERTDPIEARIEEAASAFRERDAEGRILPSPAWCDLTTEQREALFHHQIASRVLERAMDPRQLSATARAVAERMRLVEQGDY